MDPNVLFVCLIFVILLSFHVGIYVFVMDVQKHWGIRSVFLVFHLSKNVFINTEKKNFSSDIIFCFSVFIIICKCREILKNFVLKNVRIFFCIFILGKFFGTFPMSVNDSHWIYYIKLQLNNCPICRSPFRALLQLKTMRVVSTVSITDQSPSSQQTRSQTR